jgi:NAD(P)-dependent dehydrogenase (short-subunit alcohol dehydrogenase family)
VAPTAGTQFDIADEASVAALIACAVERHGGIDALFANAADLSIIHEDSDAE